MDRVPNGVFQPPSWRATAFIDGSSTKTDNTHLCQLFRMKRQRGGAQATECPSHGSPWRAACRASRPRRSAPRPASCGRLQRVVPVPEGRLPQRLAGPGQRRLSGRRRWSYARPNDRWRRLLSGRPEPRTARRCGGGYGRGRTARYSCGWPSRGWPGSGHGRYVPARSPGYGELPRGRHARPCGPC